MSAASTRRILLLSFLAVLPLAGQTNNGRIEGTVQDPTGALVPGAKLSVVNTKTQTHLEATTGSQGEYVITPLPAGIYTMTVEAPGFRKAEIQALEVNVGTALVHKEAAAPGTPLVVHIRGTAYGATVVPLPFYKRSV